MFGTIEKTKRGNYIIKVDGFPRETFVWYSRKNAIGRYRYLYGLKGRHIIWLEL